MDTEGGDFPPLFFIPLTEAIRSPTTPTPLGVPVVFFSASITPFARRLLRFYFVLYFTLQKVGPALSHSFLSIGRYSQHFLTFQLSFQTSIGAGMYLNTHCSFPQRLTESCALLFFNYINTHHWRVLSGFLPLLKPLSHLKFSHLYWFNIIYPKLSTNPFHHTKSSQSAYFSSNDASFLFYLLVGTFILLRIF